MCSPLSLRKGVREGEVTSEDREHAKRIVYSVVYGAGEYVVKIKEIYQSARQLIFVVSK